VFHLRVVAWHGSAVITSATVGADRPLQIRRMHFGSFVPEKAAVLGNLPLFVQRWSLKLDGRHHRGHTRRGAGVVGDERGIRRTLPVDFAALFRSVLRDSV